MNYFKAARKAFGFVDVIMEAADAISDGVLTPEEITKILDEGIDAIGISGIDSKDISIENRDDGGFAIVFSEKVVKKLSIDL